MDDATALALNCFMEANLEPDDGLAAIARVVMNRVKHEYMGKTTAQEVIFAHDQFSWTEWDMLHGHYVQVAHGPEQQAKRAATLLSSAQSHGHAWARAVIISGRVATKQYSGPLYNKLTDDAVMYLNPAISHQPWATPDKLICAIGHHNFYRA